METSIHCYSCCKRQTISMERQCRRSSFYSQHCNQTKCFNMHAHTPKTQITNPLESLFFFLLLFLINKVEFFFVYVHKSQTIFSFHLYKSSFIPVFTLNSFCRLHTGIMFHSRNRSPVISNLKMSKGKKKND